MKPASSILIKNKRAGFDYELMEFFNAGIVLTGTEIKSIRLGKVSLTDSYCLVSKNELWVKGIQISEYFFGTYNNHNPRRDRKLLLTKKEIRKIIRLTKETGFTIVPTKMYIDEHGLAKLQIAVAKGKKEYDKRQTIKDKDDKREMDRFFKH